MFFVFFVVKNVFGFTWIDREVREDHEAAEYKKSAPWCSSCPLR
jgi:hypothetical protein